MQHFPECYNTHSLRKLVADYPILLTHVPNHMITPKMCINAVSVVAQLFDGISKRHIAQSLCDILLHRTNHMIRDMG